ncbi:unnamed protein product [Cylindrotheca closterium]|uniref:DUF6824 domain-containing protein n=1 Tax=Cylindrotheca closterium TaxID=2856 RepID=A0AAD2G7Y0_9STRA|nr:unnamed protein product [Cylindrotheca closterium]
MANNRNSVYDPSGNLRIRKPHPHDVLSGRGGGINSHPGNKVFREWVRVRKEAYNLAVTKAEKAEVAHQVMNLVQNQQPPGRFLQRDPNSTTACSLWVELDANRALAKTSQALREGAPQIRAAHRDVGWKADRARKSKRKNRPAKTPSTSVPAPTPTPASNPKFSLTRTKMIAPATEMNKAIRALQDNVDEAKRLANQQPESSQNVPPPLMSNEDFEAKFSRQPKRGKFFNMQESTPTLTSVPVSLNAVPVNSSPAPTNANTTIPMALPSAPPVPLRSDSSSKLLRTNSLALSDFSNAEMKDEDLNQDFVNPFDDEHEIECINPAPRSTGSASDIKKLGQQQQQQQQQQSYNNNNGRSSSNTRYATEFSDLGNEPALLNADFGESMKSVWDATHPGLTSSEKGDWDMPTLLLPRRNSSEALKRLLRSPLTPRTAPAKQRDTGRQ